MIIPHSFLIFKRFDMLKTWFIFYFLSVSLAPRKNTPPRRGVFLCTEKNLRFGRGGRAGAKCFGRFHLRAVAPMSVTADGEHAVLMTVE